MVAKEQAGIVSADSMPDRTTPLVPGVDITHAITIFGIVFVAVVAAELVGNVTIPLGIANVTLFPFLWALLICVAVSIAQRRMDASVSNSVALQTTSSDFVQVCILLFVAKLSFIVGENLQVIVDAGWVLVVQEVGNFLGTMLLAMPLALLLGIKRETVGATFSIGRENGIAIISDRYGMNSPEGRGVLAEYITGSVLGAVFMAVLASLIGSLGLFSAKALGMAAGIGSGSMTAAAVGALSSQFPEEASSIAALAAASNLLTTMTGTYIILFISLPFANWLYSRLEPVLGKGRAIYTAADASSAAAPVDKVFAQAELPLGITLATVFVSSAIALMGNWIATATSPVDAFGGACTIVAITIAGIFVGRLLRGLRLPSLLWISLIGILVAAPFSPLAGTLNPLVAKVGLLPLVTPVLAYAGLSLAKDIPLLRALGWRIVVVSLVANVGAFLAAAVISEIFL